MKSSTTRAVVCGGRFGLGGGSERGSPNVVSFKGLGLGVAKKTSLTTKCEKKNVQEVSTNEEQKSEDDLHSLFSNDFCLFEVVIGTIKEKIYLPHPKARYLKYKHWRDLLLDALYDIFSIRWGFAVHGWDDDEGAYVTFKNVTGNNEEEATIYVYPTGFTYSIKNVVLASKKFFHIMEEKEKEDEEKGKKRGEEV